MKETKVQSIFKIMMTMIFKIKIRNCLKLSKIKINQKKIKRNNRDMKVKIVKRSKNFSTR